MEDLKKLYQTVYKTEVPEVPSTSANLSGIGLCEFKFEFDGDDGCLTLSSGCGLTGSVKEFDK
jgi:hypothetical protein